MARLGRDTVYGIHVSAGAKGSKGIAAEVESTPFLITGCSFQPISAAEQMSNMDLTITMWRLYAPPATVLAAVDRVMAFGTKYQVFGDPQVWTDSRGKPHHLQCMLRKATG